MGLLQANPKHKFLYERAMQKTRKGDMDSALADFTALIEIAPKMADAYFKRGYIYLRKGDLKSAAPDFEQALSLNPDHSDAEMMREMLKRYADTKLRSSGISTQSGVEVEPPSDEELLKTIGQKPAEAKPASVASAPAAVAVPYEQTPQFFLERGEQYYENGKLEEAIDDFVEAIRLDADFVDAYVNLGAIYHEYGEDELAQQYFQAALNLNPNHRDAEMMREITGEYAQ